MIKKLWQLIFQKKNGTSIPGKSYSDPSQAYSDYKSGSISKSSEDSSVILKNKKTGKIIVIASLIILICCCIRILSQI